MKMKVIAMLAAFALTASAVQAQELPRKVQNVEVLDLDGKPVKLPYFGEKNLMIFYVDPDRHKQNEDFTIELEQNHRAESDNIHGFGVMNLKDALEANSPLIRANCWEWYTSVVRTRMHNASRELIVFTRWHEEDLIGTLTAREPVAELREWAQLDGLPADTWLHLNFEALKSSPPTGIDPRMPGAALWEQQQGRALLEAKRRLDPLQFESMYQGHPSSREGLLYGLNFAEYDDLPHEIVRRGNYTDTADTGDDYLCSLSYAVDADGAIYITDAVYTREPMEVSEPLVAEMLLRSDTRQAAVESNNGGRGFARAVQSLSPGVRIEWFHQGGNKEARILSNSATALHLLRWPRGWNFRWPELYAHLTTYRRRFRANRWHDAADVVTGIVEREAADRSRSRVRGVRFL